MVSIYDLDVQCDSCNDIVELEPPRNRRKYGLIGAVLLGVLGFGIGGTIGIATAGLGIAATFPLTAIGLYSGLKGGRWAAGVQDGVKCPKCDHTY